jgi:hypothetical protein
VLSDGVGEASIEALDHAIGLWVIGFGQLVLDAMGGAQLIEGVAASACRTAGVAGSAEAVGELGAVIGEDGVDRVSERLEEAGKGVGNSIALAVLNDLDMDEARGALDGDQDIAGLAIKAREVLEIGMDIAERLGREAAGRRCRTRPRRSCDAATMPQPVQRRTRDIVPYATAQNLKRIIER